MIHWSADFIGFTANSFGDGFPIEGGKGYIINVTRSKVVRFTGHAWENRRTTVSAAPTVPQIRQVWALVLHTQLEGIDGVMLTVHNRRTGVSETIDVTGSHVVWADLSRRAVAAIGDTLTIEIHSTGGELIRTLHHEIDAADVRRAFAELVLTPEDMQPKQTVLLPNYPNPFNPETWIPYQLANNTDVEIRIYSQKGELVRSLDLGLQSAGYYVGKSHAAFWDGRNGSGELLASGVYFYKLITSVGTATRKNGDRQVDSCDRRVAGRLDLWAVIRPWTVFRGFALVDYVINSECILPLPNLLLKGVASPFQEFASVRSTLYLTIPVKDTS